MQERDERILKHIGRYGLSIRAVLEKLFFDGATGDHVINRLLKEKKISGSPSIPGGLCCYQLSLSEARARGVPEHRARPKKGAALRQALQVLLFCCMSEKDRRLLDRKKVGESFGNGNGSGKPHCAEVEGDQSMVYRIYAPGPNSRDDYLLKCLKSDTEKGMERPELRSWIEARSFAFAVLVETPERKERLKRLISRTGPYEVRIRVEVVPGLSGLAAALRRREEETGNVSCDH
jgi:hypothetical protein